MSTKRSFKSIFGSIYAGITLIFLLLTIGWYGYYYFSTAQGVKKLFNTGFSTVEKWAEEENVPELKASVNRLFNSVKEIKAFSLVNKTGVVYVLSRHGVITPPEESVENPLPPLYLPRTPWEDVTTKTLGEGKNIKILQYYYDVLSPVSIIDGLKVIVFIFLGFLLLSMIVYMGTKEPIDLEEIPVKEDEDEEEDENNCVDTHEKEVEHLDFPDLSDFSLAPPTKEEEYWYKEEEDENSPEKYAAPGNWDLETLPELELPAMEFPKEDSDPVQKNNSPDPQTVKGLFDPVTKGVWEEYLTPRLESELKRAADHNQDLVLAYICGDSSMDSVDLKSLHDVLLESFPFKDMIFNHSRIGFILILPQKTLEGAIKDLNLLFKRRELTSLSSRIAVGLSSRSGRLLDPETLQHETAHALEKAKAGHESIIGFRADPDKYRNHLAQIS